MLSDERLEEIASAYARGTAGLPEVSELIIEVRRLRQKPLEMALCESERLALRPNQPYIFHTMPDCARCVKLAERTKIG